MDRRTRRSRSQTVAVLGDSAGGNLAVAVSVAARDENLPLPSCVAAISPFADLTFLWGIDGDAKAPGPLCHSRAAGIHGKPIISTAPTPRIPGVRPFSPICTILPPLLIQVGEDEILFDDAARIRDAAISAGVDTTFAPWTHGIHVWPVLHLLRSARIRAGDRTTGGFPDAPRKAGRLVNAVQPLLQPYRMGEYQLANRIVMAPLTRCRATNPIYYRRNYTSVTYAQRASAGLIITEGTWISRDAVGWHDVPGLFTDAQVRAWSAVTDAVHRHGGLIFVQLWHTGSSSHPDFFAGTAPLAPSAVNSRSEFSNAVGQ